MSQGSRKHPEADILATSQLEKTLTCIPFGSQLRSEVERHSTNLKSGDGNKKVDSKDIQILEINQAIKASESHLQQPLVKVHSLNLT